MIASVIENRTKTECKAVDDTPPLQILTEVNHEEAICFYRVLVGSDGCHGTRPLLH